MVLSLDRRHVLAAAAAVPVLPVLAACGAASDDADETSGDSNAGSGSGSSAGQTLASTSDIDVGGALFIEGVVITQPTAGDFHAFDRTCTHQACPVTDLKNGEIHCACHNSMYDPTTGAPVSGPAPSPLKSIAIAVQGDKIVTT